MNPLGGLAGDMFCAALLDAYPDLFDRVCEAVAAVSATQSVELSLVPAEGSLRGRRLVVARRDPGASQEQDHTHFRILRTRLREAALEAGVRARALAIFTRLAEAEAHIHGTTPDEVCFHEVGAWDSLADILAAATLLEALDVQTVSCAPLPLGGGRIASAHGPLPVPAPATARLLAGLPVIDDGIAGERVTPTGAAILRSLRLTARLPAGARLQASGLGFGTRKLPGIPNCLQVLCLDAAASDPPLLADRVVQLGFEIDDQTPEDLALGLERLRQAEGVWSVLTRSAIGKKGRPTVTVEILIRPDALAEVAAACFRETTTIGLRYQLVDRLCLRREAQATGQDGRRVGVKVVERPGGVTAKAEADDLAGLGGWREREQRRREAEAEALAKASEPRGESPS